MSGFIQGSLKRGPYLPPPHLWEPEVLARLVSSYYLWFSSSPVACRTVASGWLLDFSGPSCFSYKAGEHWARSLSCRESRPRPACVGWSGSLGLLLAFIGRGQGCLTPAQPCTTKSRPVPKAERETLWRSTHKSVLFTTGVFKVRRSCFQMMWLVGTPQIKQMRGGKCG